VLTVHSPTFVHDFYSSLKRTRDVLARFLNFKTDLFSQIALQQKKIQGAGTLSDRILVTSGELHVIELLLYINNYHWKYFSIVVLTIIRTGKLSQKSEMGYS
jgi:hypothetical protein